MTDKNYMTAVLDSLQRLQDGILAIISTRDHAAADRPEHRVVSQQLANLSGSVNGLVQHYKSLIKEQTERYVGT